MIQDFDSVASRFGGRFLLSPSEIAGRLAGINTFIFDWDGVFNNGMKQANGSSPFGEIDSMGTNLLRFNHYLRHGTVPTTVIITGENNADAYHLARREHFDAVYFGCKNKNDAFSHLCRTRRLAPHQAFFMFDDVLDLGMAAKAGLRIMVGRNCNPLLNDFAGANQMADYITSSAGGNHAVREAVELLTGLSGRYEDTLKERIAFSDIYLKYLHLRNTPETQFYTASPSGIIPQAIP